MIKVIGFIAWFILCVVLNSWVTTILWGWFIVPFFFLPPLSIPLAMGLTLVVGRFVTSSVTVDFTDESTYYFGIGWPFVVLVLGWIVHLLLGA